MNWTKETPKVEGWYWARIDARDCEPEIVHLKRGKVFATGTDMQRSVLHYVDDCGGEWLGPLSPDQLLNLGRV